MTPVNYPFKIKQIPHNRKLGKIDKDYPHRREPHEDDTAKTLARFGYDLTFIEPSNNLGVNTPDCLWQKEYWEMKAPEKNRKDTYIRDIREAVEQSSNLIVDVRRSKRSVRQVAIDIISYIRKRRTKKIRKVMVLDKENYCFFTRDDVL